MKEDNEALKEDNEELKVENEVLKEENEAQKRELKEAAAMAAAATAVVEQLITKGETGVGASPDYVKSKMMATQSKLEKR